MNETKENPFKVPILGHAKKHRDVVHGAQSVNQQVSDPFRRPTFDYDLWANRPEKESDILQNTLDKKIAGGRDQFYAEKWNVAGSTEFVYRVKDRNTGEVVADFMKMPGKTKGLYKVIGGVRYETLEHAKEVYRSILNNPELRHRHSKSARDLDRILAFERSLKKGEPIRNVQSPFAMFQVKPQWRF